MKHVRLISFAISLAAFCVPFTSQAQWITVDDEVEMLDISDNVLIGTIVNVGGATSLDDAKLLVESDDINLRSIFRAEATYNVPASEEILRLVMPSTSSSGAQFVDMKNGSSTVFEVTRDGNVNISGNVDVVGELTAASDVRFKKNIATIDEAMRIVMQLRPVSYDFQTENYPGLKLPHRRKHGLIAQEVEDVVPSFVSKGLDVTDVEGNSFVSKSVNYIEMIPILLKAIQEQQTLIEELNQRLDLFEKSGNAFDSMSDVEG